jgi:uncharacterized protein YjbJ (UPF0337 family)
MSNDRIEAISHQLKGAAKSGVGRLLGDDKLKSDGAAELAAGRAQAAAARSGEPIFGVDQGRIEGIGHQMVGAVREEFGKLIGNPAIEAKGSAERAAGKLQNAAGSERDERREAGQTPATHVEVAPIPVDPKTP